MAGLIEDLAIESNDLEVRGGMRLVLFVTQNYKNFSIYHQTVYYAIEVTICINFSPRSECPSLLITESRSISAIWQISIAQHDVLEMTGS